jgi:endonuclease YncB( thermonuclease family)
MSWRSVGYEWGGVLLLLLVLAAIHIFKPEWTGIVVGSTPRQDSAYRAIDGDSFKAGETEIRLHGIDAPEYRQTCTDDARKQQPCGKLARDALSKLIRGKDVACKIIDRDRYGRQVSTCKQGTLDINREMVRLGWAVAYRRHALNYIAAEREAKTAKRGIWAWRFEMPEDYRSRNRTVQGSAVDFDFKDD